MGGRWGVPVLAVLMAAGSAAGGQNETRVLSGTVTDQHHEPLKGAVVSLEDENTMAVVTYLTDRDGAWNFKRVGVNTDYKVWVSYRGQETKKRFVSKFDSKTDLKIEFAVDLK